MDQYHTAGIQILDVLFCIKKTRQETETHNQTRAGSTQGVEVQYDVSADDFLSVHLADSWVNSVMVQQIT